MENDGDGLQVIESCEIDVLQKSVTTSVQASIIL